MRCKNVRCENVKSGGEGLSISKQSLAAFSYYYNERYNSIYKKGYIRE